MKYNGTPKNRAGYIPTGRIWPSGDFSLGWKSTATDERVETDIWEDWHRTGSLKIPRGWSYGFYGLPSPPEAVWWHSLCPDHKTMLLELGGALNLTKGSNSHTGETGQAKRGQLGITGFGRKMVKSAATMLQAMPNQRLTFATVTMPTLEPSLRRELALSWAELVRQLLQWLSRQLESQGLPAIVVSVSEVQPKRLQAKNEGYLHLHLVWPNHWAQRGNWAVSAKKCRAWCEEFLARRGLLPEGAWVNVNTQEVEKTAAGYLGKYMSKGGEVLAGFAADNGWDAVPATWWNMTKPARDMVKAALLEGTTVGAILEQVIDYTFDSDDFSGYWALHHVDLERDGILKTVGWYGVLKKDAADSLRELISSPL